MALPTALRRKFWPYFRQFSLGLGLKYLASFNITARYIHLPVQIYGME